MDSQKSILITLFIIIVTVNSKNIVHVNAVGSPSANPNSLSCMELMMNDMASCISFISKGSTDSKPDPSCCSGLKVVLGTNAECLCEALKSGGSLGIQIDFGRAATLPSACNVNAPPISKCNGAPSSSSSPPSEQQDPKKHNVTKPRAQPTPPTTAPSPSPPIKTSKMGPSSSPSASSTLGPSSPPPTTPPSPPASSTTGPSPSSSSLAPSKMPPIGSSSSLPQTPIATTMVPLPSPASDDTLTTTSPPHSSSSSSVSTIIPYVIIASCNIFLYFFA